MPRGKELEQLPAANIAPGAGKDLGKFHRGILEGIEQNEQPHPAAIKEEHPK